jgi:hypothetical protein
MATTATAVFSDHGPAPDLLARIRRIGRRSLFFIHAARSP